VFINAGPVPGHATCSARHCSGTLRRGARVTTRTAVLHDEHAEPAVADAIAKVERGGRFFRAGNELHFVENGAHEPIIVPSKRFESAVARISGLRAPAAAFKSLLSSVVERAFSKASRARIELITGRGDDGSLLWHLGAGEVRQLMNNKHFVRVANGTSGVIFQTEQGFAPLSVEALKAAIPESPQRFPKPSRMPWLSV
jgi:hypothetical protein